MKKSIKKGCISIFVILIVSACGHQTSNENVLEQEKITTQPKTKKIIDKRISLALNEMQKNHQLKNMRSHLEAVQSIVLLLGSDKFNEASKIAYTELGSTTEMKLMCASFGNKQFEQLGLNFHKSADEMSEVFKLKDKNKALEALSNTMNYCVQCHITFRQ